MSAALEEFGEIKSDVIRLKYKRDHDFAGIENGNRLVRMVLTKPSIPYSLKIDGEWCRIIHNHRQRMCSNCQAAGHSHRKCPEITCRVCGEKGHLSYDCTQEFEELHENIEENITDNTAPNENTTNAPEDNLAKNSTKDTEPPQSIPEEPETFQEAKLGENYYQRHRNTNGNCARLL